MPTRKPFAPLVALLVSLIGVAPSAATTHPLPVAPEPRLVRVTFDAGYTLEQLLRSGLDVVDVKGHDSAMILAWPQDDAAVAALGAHAQLLDEHPARAAAEAARADLARTARLQAGSGAPVERPRAGKLTAPPFGSGSLAGYWTSAEIKMKLDDLVANDTHDVVANKIDTVGYSREGRPIWGLEISKHVAGTDTRPVVFYNALTHAREPGGMQVLFWFVDDILSRYGTDPWATYLLDKRRLYIVPLVNPDGYRVNENTYTMTSSFGMWRKNTRDNDGNGTFDSDSDGVDINRNYGFQWGFDDIGSTPNVTGETYRGPSAFSEQETQVQRNLIASLKPKSGLSFHTYGDLFLHPWGYVNTPTLDNAAFHEWNDLLTRYNAYQTGQSGPVLYQVNGEFNDWCYGDTTLKPRAYTWTPEVGESVSNPVAGFWPAFSRTALFAKENVTMCEGVAAIAGAWVRADGWSIGEGALNASYFAHLTVRARNVGAGASAGPGLTGTLTALDAGVHVVGATVVYPTLASRTSGNPNGGSSFGVFTDDTVTVGRMVRFQIDFADANGLFSRDTVSVPLGTPTLLAFDDASSGTGKWTITGGPPTWGIVQDDPSHPSRYFDDSPGANYPVGGILALTLNASLDLSHGVHAYALYENRWAYECDYDAGLVEASLNGSSYTLVKATGSTPGSGVSGSVQTLGQPYYAGTRWNWKTEVADLSPFTGPAGTAVRFRFRTRSDQGGQYDGMSVDSIRIVVYDPAAQPALLAVDPTPAQALALATPWPNPARDALRIDFALPARADVRLEVLDVQGRAVRTIAAGPAAAGSYRKSWDLADGAGHRARAGVYFVRLSLPDRSLTRRFVVID